MSTLLAVHAHPDDETVSMGGTLARYSAAGVRTIVVTCTSGDLGEVLLPGALDVAAARSPTAASDVGAARLAGAAEVGALRARELDAAAACLGVGRVVNLGYFDSGMPGWTVQNSRPGAFFAADLSEATARLVEIIREERPQVLVTYDPTGGYAHPDHLKAHQVGVAAFHASGQARPAKLYFTRIPLGWSRSFVRALREAGIDAPGSAATGADAGPAVHEVGVADDLVTTTIDVGEFVAVKRAALAWHASQMPPDHFLLRMPPALARRLWQFEYFSREYGPTATPTGQQETDLFSGLP